MARYQSPGGRGQQPRGTLPARPQLPPPDSALRQRAVAALSLGVFSLLALFLGLGNLRRGILVAAVALLFALTAIWLGASSSKRARRGGTVRRMTGMCARSCRRTVLSATDSTRISGRQGYASIRRRARSARWLPADARSSRASPELAP